MLGLRAVPFLPVSGQILEVAWLSQPPERHRLPRFEGLEPHLLRRITRRESTSQLHPPVSRFLLGRELLPLSDSLRLRRRSSCRPRSFSPPPALLCPGRRPLGRQGY